MPNILIYIFLASDASLLLQYVLENSIEKLLIIMPKFACSNLNHLKY